MRWNHMLLDLSVTPAEPVIGSGQMTRPQAMQEIQKVLDGHGDLPGMSELADTWRTGQAKDDTVFFGPFVACVYEYEFTPESGAMEWLHDFQKRMGS